MSILAVLTNIGWFVYGIMVAYLVEEIRRLTEQKGLLYQISASNTSDVTCGE
jgi:hypothetical protein